jgi:hypothetical protein
VLDNADEQKSVMFLGGGTLEPTRTITYNTFSSLNWNSNRHYLIVKADHYGLISECNESNNVTAKLVKKCTSNLNLNLLGNLASGLYAANQIVNINGNAVFSPNTLVVGKAINGLANLRAFSNNVAFVIGTCLVSTTASVTSEESKDFKPIFEFLDTDNRGEINYSLLKSSVVSASVWGGPQNEKVGDLFSNQSKPAGLNSFTIDTSTWVAGNTYVIHFETVEGQWAKVVEW